MSDFIPLTVQQRDDLHAIADPYLARQEALRLTVVDPAIVKAEETDAAIEALVGKDDILALGQVAKDLSREVLQLSVELAEAKAVLARVKALPYDLATLETTYLPTKVVTVRNLDAAIKGPAGEVNT